jgi:two-component system, NarL family, sensor histidine kinase YdfH
VLLTFSILVYTNTATLSSVNRRVRLVQSDSVRADNDRSALRGYNKGAMNRSTSTPASRTPASTVEQQAARETLPFLIIVTVVLAVLYGASLASKPELRSLPAVALFTALMLAHGVLYWLVLRLPQTLPWIVAYLVVQTALATAITLLAANVGTSFGLFAALIGIAVGMLRQRVLAAAAVLILLALLALVSVQAGDALPLSWWLVAALPMTLFVVIYVLLYTRQMEAREQAQALLAELEAANRQLAGYAAQVEDLTLAGERQRLARELHDTLAQGLAGLILQLEAARSHLDAGRADRAGEIVDQAMARARSTLHAARQAIGDLRAPQDMVGDLGLAMRREAERFSAATGVPCALEIGLAAPLPEQTSQHALRIVAEALSNVAQHAQASQVWVSAVQAAGAVEITVRDDGAGFEVDAAELGAGHYGLVGMAERARLAGGELAINSAPGQGTTVRLRLPLPGEQVSHGR